MYMDISPYLSTIIILLYGTLLIFAIFRILLDTDSASKTLAYLMLVIVIPLGGIIFYFSFGVNYRHQKLDARRQLILEELGHKFKSSVRNSTRTFYEQQNQALGYFSELSNFIYNQGGEGLTRNFTELLINGEQKFPNLLEALDEAKKFIHIEYYTWENDINGNLLKDVLIRKAREGIEVRVLYDDFGSRGIRKNIVRELAANGVEIFPVIEVKLIFLANRLNHRDHRKIVIIDGHTGYVGGINVSDRYDNSIDTRLYWRDTHLKIQGKAVLYLQRHFVATWNDCQSNWLRVNETYFPQTPHEADQAGSDLIQIVAGGPIFRLPTIMLTYAKIINDARSRIFITNPYFIPNESILNTLMQASLSGVDVRLLLPGKSDSQLVAAASKFYIRGLLEAGVRVYFYQKGFIHAKTLVADGYVGVVGTANMDIRSFDLNYEIMAVSYSKSLGNELEETFYSDLKDSIEVTLLEWRKKPLITRLVYAIARLVSSLL